MAKRKGRRYSADIDNPIIGQFLDDGMDRFVGMPLQGFDGNTRWSLENQNEILVPKWPRYGGMDYYYITFPRI